MFIFCSKNSLLQRIYRFVHLESGHSCFDAFDQQG